MTGDPRSYKRRYEEADIGRVLSDAEVVVQLSLRPWKITDNYRVWVPNGIMFLHYRQFIQKTRPDLDPVGFRKFGAILNTVFPDCPMVKRRIKGKVVVGRAGLSGKGELKTNWADGS